MNTIDSQRELYASLGLGLQQPEQAHNTLEMGDFMELMITELTHQDPFKPMENTELATQISQFATVSGIGDLNKEFSGFTASMASDQTLQATSLVGREVLVPTQTGYLEAGGEIRGAVPIEPGSSNIRVKVFNQYGAQVTEQSIDATSEGVTAFTWDGKNDAGIPAPAGEYRISIEAETDGKAQALPTMIVSTVDSISVGAAGQGVFLNFKGQGSVALQDVSEFH